MNTGFTSKSNLGGRGRSSIDEAVLLLVGKDSIEGEAWVKAKGETVLKTRRNRKQLGWYEFESGGPIHVLGSVRYLTTLTLMRYYTKAV